METTDLALRLSDIVEKRYGCTVQFLKPEDLPNHPEILELLERHPKVPRFVTGAGLYLPVRALTDLDGVVVVTGLNQLDGNDLERICEMTEAVIISLFQDIRDHASLFAKFESAITLPAPLADIISMSERRSSRPVQFTSADVEKEDADIIPLPGRSTKYPDPLLLVGTGDFDFHRLAFDIHNDSGSSCFLPWEALTIKSSDELFALGGMTIFIRDLTKLLEHEQSMLATFLATQTEDERPKIIAVAEAPAMDLAAVGKIQTGLAFVFHEVEVEHQVVH